MSQKRKFTTVIRIGDAIHYNEQLDLMFNDKTILSVNPVSLGQFDSSNRMFLEAYINDKVYVFDFEFIYTCLNREQNNDHKTTTNIFDTIIFKRTAEQLE